MHGLCRIRVIYPRALIRPLRGDLSTAAAAGLTAPPGDQDGVGARPRRGQPESTGKMRPAKETHPCDLLSSHLSFPLQRFFRQSRAAQCLGKDFFEAIAIPNSARGSVEVIGKLRIKANRLKGGVGAAAVSDLNFISIQLNKANDLVAIHRINGTAFKNWENEFGRRIIGESF
jgi:hypothetical protein